MLLVVALAAFPPRAAAQEPASRFDELLAARGAASSLVGPFSGKLVQSDGFVATTGAALSLEEFSATATFLNPTAETDTPWDFGFTFHRTGDAAQQIVIDSNGLWYQAPYPEGTIDSGFVLAFDSTPGGTNTVDLIVEGATALLGVNGEFVADIALPPAVASDVQIGSGYFTGTTVDGRAIAYRDFEVWSLPGTAPSAPTATSEPTSTAASTPTISTEDGAAFVAILAAQSQAEPLAGPFNANLTEEDDRVSLSWADVDLADFHAQATFTVPKTTSDTPWDIGFFFRASASGTLRVVVDSGGHWRFSVGSATPSASGIVSGLVTDPGGTNTLDLIVADDLAVLGVNGAFISMIDLPTDSSAADVAVGAAFFTEETLAGRNIPFNDFVVLPFDPDVVSAIVPSATDADVFERLVEEITQESPLVGPLAGRLVESSPGTAPLAAAGVALIDFAAAATFVTPVNVSDGLWDAGFQFRGAGDVRHRIVLGGSGEVYAVLPGEPASIVGMATNFDATPGAANTLHLFVEDGRALVGVNGEFVTAVELAASPIAGDVLAGAAFFDEDFAQDRVTAYEDFKVWEIT
jgi:hypothetical protein